MFDTRPGTNITFTGGIIHHIVLLKDSIPRVPTTILNEKCNTCHGHVSTLLNTGTPYYFTQHNMWPLELHLINFIYF